MYMEQNSLDIVDDITHKLAESIQPYTDDPEKLLIAASAISSFAANLWILLQGEEGAKEILEQLSRQIETQSRNQTVH